MSKDGIVMNHPLQNRVVRGIIPLLVLVSWLATGTILPALAKTTDSTPISAYLNSRIALREGDFKRAKELSLQLIKKDPNSQFLLDQIVILSVADGDIKQAQKTAKSVTNTKNNLLLGLLNLSYALKEKQYQDLLANQEKDGNQIYNELVLPLFKAYAQAGLGKYEEAHKILIQSKLSELNPDIMVIAQARLWLSQGQYKEIIDSYQKNYGGANDLLSNLAMKPIELGLPLFQTYLMNGDKELAQAWLKQMKISHYNDERVAWFSHQMGKLAPLDSDKLKTLAKQTDLDSSPAEQMGQILVNMVPGIVMDDNFTKLLLLRVAAYLKDNDAASSLEVADILIDDNRYDMAESILKPIKDSNYLSLKSELSKADLEIVKKNNDKAIEHLNALSQTYPDDINSLIKLGFVYRVMEKFLDATKVYQQAINRLESQPDIDKRLLGQIYYYLGMSQERSDNWTAAEVSLKKANELKPNDASILNYLGYSWVDKKVNLEEAMKMINQAVSLKPREGYIIDSLGWAYFRLGNLDESIKYMERAILLSPGDSAINDHLGDVYWAAGRKREAVFQWQRALEFMPDDELKTKINQKLAERNGA